MNIANKNLVFFLTFASFLIIFAGFRPIGFDFDSQTYANLIYVDYQLFEPTFALITGFANLFTSDKENIIRIVLFTYAFLNIVILSIAINKFIKFNIISLLVYTLVAYAMVTVTQIRFGVALSFFLWAIYDLSNSNRKGFLIKILIATSFHYSLILALPLIFLSASSINRNFYIFLPLIFSLSILFKNDLLNLLINNIHFFSDYLALKLKAYIHSEQNRTTFMPLINFLSLLVIFIYYLSLSNITKLTNKNMLVVIKVIGWGLAIYFLLSFADIFTKRVLFTLTTLIIIIIPFIISYFKQKRIFLFFIISYMFIYFINLTVRYGIFDYSLYFTKGILS